MFISSHRLTPLRFTETLRGLILLRCKLQRIKKFPHIALHFETQWCSKCCSIERVTSVYRFLFRECWKSFFFSSFFFKDECYYKLTQTTFRDEEKYSGQYQARIRRARMLSASCVRSNVCRDHNGPPCIQRLPTGNRFSREFTCGYTKAAGFSASL